MVSQELFSQLMSVLAQSDTFQSLPEEQKSAVVESYMTSSDEELKIAIAEIENNDAEPVDEKPVIDKASELERKVKSIRKGLLNEDIAQERKDSVEKAEQIINSLGE